MGRKIWPIFDINWFISSFGKKDVLELSIFIKKLLDEYVKKEDSKISGQKSNKHPGDDNHGTKKKKTKINVSTLNYKFIYQLCRFSMQSNRKPHNLNL